MNKYFHAYLSNTQKCQELFQVLRYITERNAQDTCFDGVYILQNETDNKHNQQKIL